MWATFEQAYDRVGDRIQPGPGNQGTATKYIVRDGDTFASIALTLWGDQSLWYLIADANGMSGDAELAAGMTLVIPNQVHNFHNNADTFRPYDPNKAIGNTAPTNPKSPPPTKQPSCSLAMIFVAIIAIVVTAVVAKWALPKVFAMIGGEAATATAVAATETAVAAMATVNTLHGVAAVITGVTAAAAGSVVSQGVAMAMGLQDHFSWNQVGLSAVSGGVGGVLSSFGPLTGGGFGMAAARGAVGNAITQGVGRVTGMVDKFDWTGVAVAGVVSGVGYAVGDAITSKLGDNPHWWEVTAADGAANLMGGMAGAAAKSLIDGTDFGDNLISTLPDALAATVGNAIARGLTTPRQREQITPIDEDKLISADAPVEAEVFEQNTDPDAFNGGYDDHPDIMGLQKPYATPRLKGDGLGTVVSLNEGQYALLDEARNAALLDINSRRSELKAYISIPSENVAFVAKWRGAFGDTPMSAANLQFAMDQLDSMKDHVTSRLTMYMFNDSDDYVATARYIPTGEGAYGGRPLVTLYRGFFADPKGVATTLFQRTQYIEHELSHFEFGVVDKIARQGPYKGLPAYGRERAAALARYEPARAFRNAENWARFVSNKPLPVWGKGAFSGGVR